MLSYFGTDQSQVQRYLSGKSLREMQLGMIFNGILKVPMQFFILFISSIMLPVVILWTFDLSSNGSGLDLIVLLRLLFTIPFLFLLVLIISRRKTDKPTSDK